MSFTRNDIRSTDVLIPEVPSAVITFRDECFAWESEAERLGNIITINAINPETANFETFGQAWLAHGASVSPSNPYIFEFHGKHNLPVDAISRGIAQYIPVVITNHPGGVVIRSRGQDRTWLINPVDYQDYVSQNISSGSVVKIDGARVFIKDLRLGFGRGNFSTADTFERDSLISIFANGDSTTKSTFCELIDSEFAAFGAFCNAGTGTCIRVEQNVSQVPSLCIVNCYLNNQYDFLICTDHGKGTGMIPSELGALFVIENCRIYAAGDNYSIKYTITDNSDGLAPITAGATWLMRHCEFRAGAFARFMFARGPLVTAGFFNPSASSKVFIQDCDFVYESSVLTGYPMIVTFNQSCPNNIYVIQRCSVRLLRDQLDKMFALSSPPYVIGTNARYGPSGQYVIGALAGMIPSGTTDYFPITMYIVDCYFLLDFRGWAQLLDDNPDIESLGKKFYGFMVSDDYFLPLAGDYSQLRLYVINTQVEVRGSARERALYEPVYKGRTDAIVEIL